MADLPTRADLFNVGRRAVVNTPNQRINPEVIDLAGSDANLILGAMSLIGEEIVAALASCMRGLYIETARADQLDRRAFDNFGLVRFSATPARVDVTLERPAPGPAGTYAAGSRVQTPNGTQYATDTDLVFAGATLEGTVSATALVSGPDGYVSAGAITQFLDQPFDTTFTVTNTFGAGGGAEAESDTEFRGRIRDVFPTVRRGTLGAISFGGLQVPGIAVAKSFEILNPAPVLLPAAFVQLIVSDRDGSTPLPSGLVQDVTDTLIEFRAAGIPVQVLGGSVQNVGVTWDLDFVAGFDSVSVTEQVRSATVATAQFLAPNGPLFRSSLISAARTVPGAIVRDTSLVAPLGDVYPATPDVLIRIRPSDVAFL